MAILLTRDYQKISTISLTYGEIRTYAKYESQSTEYNTTSIKIKATYYTGQSSLSFDRGTININGDTTNFEYVILRKGETDLKEITATINHNDNGTSPNYNVYTAWTATYGGYGDINADIYAPTINRMAIVTSATDFTDEGNPTIYYTNPAGFRINAKLEFKGVQIVRENIPNTGSYTFELTNEERTILRQKCTGNSLTIREVIATCLSGTTESLWSWQDKTMTIVNGNPVFSNFEFQDVNPTTIALTGNNQINVNGYSNTRITISSVNKAEAQKEASMIKYRYSNGTNSTDITYSDSDVTGTINGTTSGTHNVYAIDSRNNSTLVTKLSSQEINYESIFVDKQNSSIVRNNNGVGDGAILTLNGSIWNNSFGLVTNSITNVSYRLKKTDESTWNTGTTTITPTITDNTFTFTGLIASNNQDTTWDLDGTYNVELTIEDELSSYTIELILNSAVPTISLDKNGVGIMCAFDSSLGGKLQVDGKIIDGGKVLWVNNDITSNFSAQTITLNSDDYDFYEVIFKQTTSIDRAFSSGKILKGYGTILNYHPAQAHYRAINYTTDTSLFIGEGVDVPQYGSTSSNNSQCIPIYIIGYKTNLFN